MPHILCGYLREFTGEFMTFYDNRPGLDAPGDATRHPRRLTHLDLSAAADALRARNSPSTSLEDSEPEETMKAGPPGDRTWDRVP